MKFLLQLLISLMFIFLVSCVDTGSVGVGNKQKEVVTPGQVAKHLKDNLKNGKKLKPNQVYNEDFDQQRYTYPRYDPDEDNKYRSPYDYKDNDSEYYYYPLYFTE